MRLTSISTAIDVKMSTNGTSTVACVIAGPSTGYFCLEVRTATQYVALGARDKLRAANNQFHDVGILNGCNAAKVMVANTALLRRRVVGPDPYRGSNARSYAKIMRDVGKTVAIAFVACNRMDGSWLRFTTGFGGAMMARNNTKVRQPCRFDMKRVEVSRLAMPARENFVHDFVNK